MSSWILLASVCLLVWALILARRKSRQSKRDESLSRLEEVIRSAELTNSVFFRSLELVQNNLESLLARADGAEQRLRNLILQPGIEKKDHYAAAALLLSEGKDATRVASMLNLPVAQVQLVEELRRVARKDKTNGARKKIEEHALSGQESHKSKVARSEEKNAARPILLTEVISTGEVGTLLPDGQYSRSRE